MKNKSNTKVFFIKLKVYYHYLLSKILGLYKLFFYTIIKKNEIKTKYKLQIYDLL